MMKRTGFLMLMACLLIPAVGLSQNVTYSGKNVPLEKVFTAVEKQTGYVFFYDEKILKDTKPVSIKAEQMPLEKFLQAILKDQPLRFGFQNKTIVISSKSNAETQIATEQLSPIALKGRIINEKNEAVAGASVKVKSTDIGTSTNANGVFSLQVPSSDMVLVISGVNIETTEFPIKGQTELTSVVVKMKVTSIDEVHIVSTGYQQISRERITGSVVKMDNEKLNRAPGMNIISRLDGITPGLLFDKRRSDRVRLQIRGLYTLNNSNNFNPLIVIDNFPFEGNLDAINPNDIEDITILRDAAATSIWGARAGNGVIIINTKKGKFNQQQQVSFNSSVTVTEKPDLFDLNLLSSSEAINFTKFLFDQGTYNTTINNVRRPALPGVVEILLLQKNGSITADEANSRLDALRRQDVRNDMLSNFYQPAVLQTYAAGFTTGSRNSSFYLSAGYDKRLDNSVGNQSERISFRMHNSFQPIKNLLMQAAVNYSIQQNDNNGLAWGSSELRVGSASMPLYTKLVGEDGNALVLDRISREAYLDTLGRGRLLDWKYRPFDEIRNRDNTSKLQTLLANLGIRYNVTNAITAELNYQYERGNTTDRNLNNINTYYTRDLINQFTNVNATDPAIRNPVPIGGILDQNNTVLEAHNLRGQVNINQRWGNDHILAAIAGGEVRQRYQNSNAARTYAYNDRLNNALIDYVNRYPKFLGSSGNIPTVTESFPFFTETRNRFASAFANASYTYKGRYIVSASARKDASNVFGAATNKKGRPFWSVGGSWKISDENFYKLKWLPVLKTRLTYGYNGNYDASATAITTVIYLPASTNTISGMPYSIIRTVPNPNLRWERVGQWNMAIDFQSKNERVAGSVEYYIKRSTDVITNSLLDPTTGTSTIASMLINSAAVRGNGFDIRIITRNIDNTHFRWTTDMALSSARFKVTAIKTPITNTVGSSLSDGDKAPSLAIAGYNPYEVISYGWGGLDPATGNPMGMIDGKPFKNHDSIQNIKLSDLVFHGPNVPEYFGNLLNSFSYKNLTLSANITYRFHYYFRRQSVVYRALVSNSGFGHTDYMKRWQKTGDEAHTSVPAFVYPFPANIREQLYTNSEVLVEKGDHIRWQDIRLSYTLNASSGKKQIFKQITIYSIASNLNILLWKANKAGVDPDFREGMKTPRSIAVGLNANF